MRRIALFTAIAGLVILGSSVWSQGRAEAAEAYVGSMTLACSGDRGMEIAAWGMVNGTPFYAACDRSGETDHDTEVVFGTTATSTWSVTIEVDNTNTHHTKTCHFSGTGVPTKNLKCTLSDRFHKKPTSRTGTVTIGSLVF